MSVYDAYRGQDLLTNPPPPSKNKNLGPQVLSSKELFQRALNDLNAIRIDANMRDPNTEMELGTVIEMVARLAKGENIMDMFSQQQPQQPNSIQTIANGRGFAPPPGAAGIPQDQLMTIGQGMYGTR